VLFTEPSFLFLFLPLLLSLYFLPTRRHRNVLLLAASLAFYAKGGGRFTLLLVASIVFNYLIAIAIDRRRDSRNAKRLLAVAVALNLVVLGIFKYAAFVVANVNLVAPLLHARAMPLPQIVLPIGISFFTFHAISYLVDVYRRDAKAQKSPIEAALYLLLFPQLIAGPIIRYREIADQLAARLVRAEGFAGGAVRFTIGLAKKVLVANVVAVAADAIFAMPTRELTAAHAWLGAIAYTLQIYFDFSGYSDMAIGLGAMFGFRFPENFNYPYISVSVQDFWRRWHMSLSRWFRDYVYVPLGGNRVSPSRTYVNLVAVFFLCGLWHGASWSFVVWGLYHGAFLVWERVAPDVSLPRPLRHLYVLLVVIVGWVFFRADSLPQALAFLRAMAGLGVAAPTAYGVSWYLTPQMQLALAAGVIGSVPVVAHAARALDTRMAAESRAVAMAFDVARSAALVLLLAACAMFIAASSYNPFIYFRF
jgi:alginate O-acetyltransferase complex protein AlgI